jgi:carboxynorspermidine decarboxylase
MDALAVSEAISDTAATLDGLETPCFVIRERDLLRNLERTRELKVASGAKVVLALKCFSTWGVFELMQPFLDGTTSSSLFEARLGHEKFGGETHAFSVGYSEADVRQLVQFSNKIIFNSASQLANYRGLVPPEVSIGLRLNPEVSYAHQDLADPARPYSRLGVRAGDLSEETLRGVSGFMFHFNCENEDFPALKTMIDKISQKFGPLLDSVRWVSLGGGISFTNDGFPLHEFADYLREFQALHGVQVYLEPGEAIVTKTTDLIVTVLDIVDNGMQTAIVDSATEAHRLDTLIFSEPAKIREASSDGQYVYFIGSCSCLAGDVFCSAKFDRPLQVGDRLSVMDSAGYTMVKLNWFNGLRMPSVFLERLSGEFLNLNAFSYDDYVRAMSSASVAR